MDEEKRSQIRFAVRGGTAFLVLLFMILLLDGALSRRELRKAGGTTFGTVPTGQRGLYEVLDGLGFGVGRFRRTYGALPAPGESVLVSLAPSPYQRFLRGEARAFEDRYPGYVRDWVEAGGVVVYTPPGTTVGGELDWISIAPLDSSTLPPLVEDLPADEVHSRRAIPNPFSEVVPADFERTWVPVHGPLRGRGPLEGHRSDLFAIEQRLVLTLQSHLRMIDSGEPEADEEEREEHRASFAGFVGGQDFGEFEPILVLDESPLALMRPLGEGRVIAFSSTYPWTNAAVARSGATVALVELLSWASDGGARTIHFDEFAHGYVHREGLLRWVWQTDVRFLVYSCLIGAALFAWRGAIRQGPPHRDRALPRRAKEEFVVSLADLYARAGRPLLAAERIVRGLEEEVAAATGAGGVREFEELRRRLPELLRQDRGLLAVARAAHEAHDRAMHRIRGATGGRR